MICKYDNAVINKDISNIQDYELAYNKFNDLKIDDSMINHVFKTLFSTNKDYNDHKKIFSLNLKNIMINLIFLILI